jgi:hypothetical protein
MNKNNYELNVLVNGKPVREYFKNGRFYIEAKDGTEYSLKLKNHSHKKIMAVVSVDGIDVIKGKNAAEVTSGYVVNPYSTLNVVGYRIDDNNSVTFKFSDGKNSYATQVENNFDPKKLEKVQKGDEPPSRNNGVIGVRIWEEKTPNYIPDWCHRTPISPSRFYEYVPNYDDNLPGDILMGVYRGYAGPISGCMVRGVQGPVGLAGLQGGGGLRSSSFSVDNISYCSTTSFGDTSNTFDVCDSHVPDFSLGTSWGQKTEDKVKKVEFERAESYVDLEIFYLVRAEMEKIGIDFENAKKVFLSGFPEAFSDYCKKPTNWEGK